ncbi:MAG: patatin-like phospholipase family protein [Firmicutes bacterium]|nr:patatin-like phospholipase family protein [Bacillota bacterium]
MKTHPLGLVLSGGGGKGAYQIGAWRALIETGWDSRITAVSGASVGALNAALMGCTDYAQAEQLWKNITPLQFLDIDLPLEGDGIFSREGLIQLIRGHLDLTKMAASPRRIFANTTQIDGENDYWARYFELNHQSPDRILKILLASSAIPVAYPSVNIDGTPHMDGGVMDNLPVKPLYDIGLRHMVVINITSDDDLLIPAVYPGTEFVEVRPSQDIGHLFDGTLDFTARGARFRMELGYRNTLRTLRAYESGQLGKPEYMRKAAIDARADYEQIRVEMLHENLNSNVNRHMDQFDAILKKYNI